VNSFLKPEEYAMRLKLIATLFCLTLLTTFVLAQDDGGKPLPGEGTPTITPIAPASETPAEPDDSTATPTPSPTTFIEEPTPEEPTPDDNTGVEEGELDTDMLEDAGIEIEDSELVLHEPFEDEDAWELGEYDTGSMYIDDEQYFVTSEEGGVFLWGQNTEEHSNVVIQVTAEQISDEDNNSYGIMCRANPENNADGYHFRITGDGAALIFTYEGGRQRALVEENDVDAINQGQEVNTITAVCIDTYMALFVNGEFVLEFADDTYSEGVTGLAAGNVLGDTDTEIAFDDVYIWEIGDATVPELEIGEDSTDLLIDSELDADEAADEVTDALEQGDVEIELGDLLLSSGFSYGGAWNFYNGDMARDVNTDDEVYRFEGFGENFFFWAQNGGEEENDDVVIRVDVELVTGEDSEYGLMCRSTENADGYNFLLSSTGEYIISYWDGDTYEVLVQDESDAINTGEDSNTIYLVCVGEYFAFYANGELLEEIEDDMYDEGLTSLVAMPRTDDDVIVDFDNFYVWEAND
jgi:hypothetical protein